MTNDAQLKMIKPGKVCCDCKNPITKDNASFAGTYVRNRCRSCRNIMDAARVSAKRIARPVTSEESLMVSRQWLKRPIIGAYAI